MEVILKEDYLTLGYVGDTVRVRRGFARNYLIPRGIAVEASRHNDRILKHALGAILAKRLKKKAEAEVFGATIKQVIVEFTLKIGLQGKSFGAVTSRDIEGALKTLGYEVDRRQVRVVEPIKSVGMHTVEVRLHSEVTVPLQVKVIAAQQAAPVDEAAAAERAERKAKKKKAKAEAAADEISSDEASE